MQKTGIIPEKNGKKMSISYGKLKAIQKSLFIKQNENTREGWLTIIMKMKIVIKEIVTDK